MPDLTFGEQVKIVLGRKGMTIKELAEMIEQRTDKKMSRQNLTQRLGRDNFQEQDMRMIASILDCPFRLSILGEDTLDEREIEAAKAGSVKEETALDTWEEESAALSGDIPGEDACGKTDVQGDAPEESSARKGETSGAASEEEDIQTAEGSERTDHIDNTGEKAEYSQAEERGEEPQVTAEGEPGREITVGEFLEIRKSSGESAQEQLMQELLAEMDSIEREDRERSIAWEERRRIKEQQEAEKKVEKKGGWMSRFRFRKHEEVMEPEEYFDEADVLPEEIEGESADTEEDGRQEEEQEEREEKGAEPATFSDRIKEYTSTDEELDEEMYEDEEEDLEAGDVNPYTGREYFSNSVRMHPKRIGYVQVYNRRDHKWTDMTEWAFLGYQERKKMLLGKDYEPPIYLD